MSRANFVQVRLAAAATDIQTTLSVKAPDGGLKAPPADGGRLVLTDSPGRPTAFEVITYTGRTGTGPYTLTGVSRGQEGTVGLSWAVDAYAMMVLTVGEFETALQAMIDGLTAADIPNLDASKITSGVLSAARIPTLNQNTTGSAAKLTTPRNINGTPFDGSQTITTAYWGASRSFTYIGDVTGAGSVNGAGDVSFSLSLKNSGVTAGTHTKVTVDAKGIVTGGADLVESDIPTLSIAKVNGLQTAINYASGLNSGITTADPNLATTQVMLTNHANSPGLGKYWHITTTFYSSFSSTGNRAQIAVEYNADGTCRAFVRSCYNTNWTAWNPIDNASLTAADIPALDAAKVATGVLDAARIPTLNQSTTGNAATATKLATARTIGGVSFDGSANISLPGVNAAGNQNTSGNAATATKLASITTSFTGVYPLTVNVNGVIYSHADITFEGSTGILSAPKFSGDGSLLTGLNASNLSTGTIPAARVPTLNQSTTGNAATATALATARTIGGVSFNGTANINLPGVNTAGNQSTTGNAATATTLATARTINGTSFNGGANITTALWGTARTITIGSAGKSVNGSANIAWTLSEIGAAAESHTHDYLPLAGGTVAGDVVLSSATASTSPTTGALKVAGGVGVGGSVYAAGNVGGLSDIRVKTNIEVIEGALDKVGQLRGVVFDRTDINLRQTGVIAQEVQAVLPEAVSADGEYLTVAYGNMVGLLIEAVKELRAEVNRLKGGA